MKNEIKQKINAAIAAAKTVYENSTFDRFAENWETEPVDLEFIEELMRLKNRWVGTKSVIAPLHIWRRDAAIAALKAAAIAKGELPPEGPNTVEDCVEYYASIEKMGVLVKYANEAKEKLWMFLENELDYNKP